MYFSFLQVQDRSAEQVNNYELATYVEITGRKIKSNCKR